MDSFPRPLVALNELAIFPIGSLALPDALTEALLAKSCVSATPCRPLLLITLARDVGLSIRSGVTRVARCARESVQRGSVSSGFQRAGGCDSGHAWSHGDVARLPPRGFLIGGRAPHLSSSRVAHDACSPAAPALPRAFEPPLHDSMVSAFHSGTGHRVPLLPQVAVAHPTRMGPHVASKLASSASRRA